jgi:hypothetical protein
VAILGGSIIAIVTLMPKANLLPQAPSDSLNAFFITPPGGTIEVLRDEIAGTIVERMRPYMEREKQPYIRGYNLSAFGAFNGMFVYPEDPSRIEEMIAIVRDEVLVDLPDTRSFVQRSSLLNFGFDGGRAIIAGRHAGDADRQPGGPRRPGPPHSRTRDRRTRTPAGTERPPYNGRGARPGDRCDHRQGSHQRHIRRGIL